MKRLKYMVTCLYLVLAGYSQVFQSISNANNGGIYKTLYNPADGAGSHSRLSINLLGAGIEINNNVFRSTLKYSLIEIAALKPLRAKEGEFISPYFDLPRESIRFPNASVNVDVLKLGVQVALGNKVSIYAYGRERVGGNINNFEYNSLRELMDGNVELKGLPQLKVDARAIAYKEKGVGFSAVLYNRRGNLFKAGTTLKQLDGIAAFSFYMPYLNAQLDGYRLNLQTKMEMVSTSLYKDEFTPSDAVNLPRTGKGYGVDFGFIYEHHPYKSIPTYKRVNPRARNKKLNSNVGVKYDYKVSFSLLDAGKITYADKNIQTNKFEINANFNVFELIGKGEELLNDSIVNQFRSNEASFNLPTKAILAVDLRLQKGWFLACSYSQNLIKTKPQTIYLPTHLFVELRREFENVTYSFPVIIVPSARVFTFGAMVQAGPFFIGSNNLPTLFMHKLYNPSLYIGLCYTLKYKKDKSIENYNSFKTRRKPRF
jgi:hypothetical protein